MNTDPNKQPGQKPNPGGDGKKPKTNIWVALTIAVIVVLLIGTIYNAVSASQYTKTTYSDFVDAMDGHNLTEVEVQGDRIVYMTREEAI